MHEFIVKICKAYCRLIGIRIQPDTCVILDSMIVLINVYIISDHMILIMY